MNTFFTAFFSGFTVSAISIIVWEVIRWIDDVPGIRERRLER